MGASAILPSQKNFTYPWTLHFLSTHHSTGLPQYIGSGEVFQRWTTTLGTHHTIRWTNPWANLPLNRWAIWASYNQSTASCLFPKETSSKEWTWACTKSTCSWLLSAAKFRKKTQGLFDRVKEDLYWVFLWISTFDGRVISNLTYLFRMVCWSSLSWGERYFGKCYSNILFFKWFYAFPYSELW